MQCKINLHPYIPTILKQAALYVESRLKNHGYEAYLIGGSVRDLLLQKKISDLDFTTNATPEEMLKIFPKVIPVGIKFGTIIVLYKSIPIEVTTYRTDQDYNDGRHPSTVIFGSSLEEDIYRRDFTINGMAYDLSEHILMDHINGLDDLKNKMVKSIGNPMDRFMEDGLRAIRGCRFAATLDFIIDENTKQAITKTISSTKKVAYERFHDEWKKTLLINSKYSFWQLLKETQLLPIFLPNITFYHDSNLFLQYLEFIKIINPTSMSVSLLSIAYFEQKVTNQSKENFKKNIQTIAKNIKFSSNDIQEAILYLYSPFLQLKDINSVSIYQYKRCIYTIPEQTLEIHKQVIASILYFEQKITSTNVILSKFIQYDENIKRNKHCIYLKDLCINGSDILSLDLRGQQIGQCLIHCHSIVLRFPAINQKNILVKIILKYKNKVLK